MRWSDDHWERMYAERRAYELRTQSEEEGLKLRYWCE